MPYPPFELANRVGAIDTVDDPWTYYENLGARVKQDILGALPAGWSINGRRVLDFGCGAGRTLRHFLDEAGSGQAELHGSDIDVPSIEWLREHLSPPLHVFVNGVNPPLDRPAETFDLIWAVSVFTHLTDSWAAWLLELHRVLKPGGYLVCTFMGRGMSEAVAAEPWDESRVGMLTLRPGESWDIGGPMVLHSPWWIRGHWGRLFEIVSVQEDGFGDEPGRGHGIVVARKDDRRPPSPADLNAPDVQDHREAIALAHNVRRLSEEAVWLRQVRDGQAAQLERGGQARALTEQRLAVIEGSRSWQITAPFRRGAQALRARRAN